MVRVKLKEKFITQLAEDVVVKIFSEIMRMEYVGVRCFNEMMRMEDVGVSSCR